MEQEVAAALEASPDLSSSATLSEETQAAARIPSDIGSLWRPTEDDKPSLRTQQSVSGTSGTSSTSGSNASTFDGQPPVDTVLHMDPPLEKPMGDTDLPHLVPPPYVHHFDTYTLTKRVEAGGFTPSQSIETMKIVRSLLAENLAIAQHGLVSKSDVENETYLFQAACSELRTEIQNSRRTNDEKLRMQRTLLQHEVDILNQKLTQDLASLKDDLRGMFNDRKMDVRMEQRSMESAIQELNYKITVALNSDSKSEVEGVRWILTRRSVLAIVFMAVVVLSSLRLASYRSHEAALAQQRAEKQAEQDKQRGVNMREGGTQTEAAILGAEGLSVT